jgi:lysophospholipase L1-like esterase
MVRRTWPLALVVGALLATSQPIVASADTTPPLPSSIAAVGDSITQAVSSGGSLGATYPQNSWSTGTSSTVDSHYQRLLVLNPAISGHADNHSVSGADMADLNGQMAGVVGLAPDYLTVLIGGNDLCTDTVDQMTPVSTFHDEFVTAMDTLSAGSPGTNVYVASIPNVYQLWQLFHNNWWARVVWSLGDICQSLLANPTSTNATDVARRAAVAQRNVAYNAALADVCAQYARCRFDGNAVYDITFSSSDVAGDYFHPSISGQAKLAQVTWDTGYWPDGGPTTDNPPTAAFSSSCSDLACSFDASGSSDDNGVVSYGWAFGDTATGSGQTTGHTYASDGTYSVTLTVTDTGGQTDSISHDVVVSAPSSGGGTVHVAALSASPVSRKGGWTATVTVSIADDSGQPVDGAAVSGTWSNGGSAGCTTGGTGTCSFSTNMNKKTKSATYSVTDVAAAGYTYVPGDNVVTSRTVSAP